MNTTEYSKVPSLLGRVLITLAVPLVLTGAAQAQIRTYGGMTWDASPEAEAWAEDAVTMWAMFTGNDGLVVAIGNGVVNCYPGNPGAGNDGGSLAPPNGPTTEDSGIIVVPPEGEAAGAVGEHEWVHMSNGHTGLTPGCDPTDGELQQQACNECAAHCAVLAGFQYAFDEFQVLVNCGLLDKVKKDAERECLACELGVGMFGPPSQPACGGATNIPCH